MARAGIDSGSSGLSSEVYGGAVAVSQKKSENPDSKTTKAFDVRGKSVLSHNHKDSQTTVEGKVAQRRDFTNTEIQSSAELVARQKETVPSGGFDWSLSARHERWHAGPSSPVTVVTVLEKTDLALTTYDADLGSFLALDRQNRVGGAVAGKNWYGTVAGTEMSGQFFVAHDHSQLSSSRLAFSSTRSIRDSTTSRRGIAYHFDTGVSALDKILLQISYGTATAPGNDSSSYVGGRADWVRQEKAAEFRIFARRDVVKRELSNLQALAFETGVTAQFQTVPDENALIRAQFLKEERLIGSDDPQAIRREIFLEYSWEFGEKIAVAPASRSSIAPRAREYTTSVSCSMVDATYFSRSLTTTLSAGVTKRL